MSKSKIQWTEYTWNPISGCRRKGQGCLNCYAERVAHRLGSNPNEKIQALYSGLTQITNGRPGWTGEIGFSETALLEPLKRRKPTRYFISLSDLFYGKRPDEHIDMVHQVMGAASWHEYVVLTKYVEQAEVYYARLRAMADKWAPNTKSGKFTASDVLNLQWMHRTVNRGPTFPYGPWPLPQLTLGVSISTQSEADALIPVLLRIPAARRIVSVEPLIEAVDLRQHLKGVCGYYCEPMAGHVDHADLDGVIVGGESGPGARPCRTRDIRSLVRQCKDASVPCFVKQLGAVCICDTDDEWPDDTQFDVCPIDGHDKPYAMRAVLKDRKGGCWSEWPEDLRVREWPEAEDA